MKHLTLTELTQKIKSLFFGFGEHWVSAEISEVSIKGHCYLDLVQKDDKTNTILARIRANLWQNTLWALRTSTQGEIDVLLKKGNKVLLLVSVSFHESYGLSLVVHKVDVSYTMGELELRRLKTIENLVAAGLHERQKKLSLPLVIQRVAVISSHEAAGYEDFLTHLQQNSFGYALSISLFASAVQGEKAEAEIVARLEEIGEIGDDFDVVVIMRGGGSRLDLEVFNSEKIAQTIAIMPLPVLTGIGHQKDQSVADFVSFQSLKTPTALADFVLQHNAVFEQHCTTLMHQILQLAQQKMNVEKLQLTDIQNRINFAVQQNLQNHKQKLSRLTDNLYYLAEQNITKQKNLLEKIAQAIDLLDPKNILQRGYTISLLNGKPLSAQTSVKAGDEVQTKGLGFEIKSKVIEQKL